MPRNHGRQRTIERVATDDAWANEGPPVLATGRVYRLRLATSTGPAQKQRRAAGSEGDDVGSTDFGLALFAIGHATLRNG